MKTEIKKHDSLRVVTLKPENQEDREIIDWLKGALILVRRLKRISNTPDNSLIPNMVGESLVFGFDKDLPNIDLT